MSRSEQIKTQIEALQAELAEIERDGFKPLSELAHELKPGDLIEMRVSEIDKNHNCPVMAGNEWLMRDTLARKSRPADPALKWITAAEASKMPDIVGKRVIAEQLVVECTPDCDDFPIRFHGAAWSPSDAKLAVLDDE